MQNVFANVASEVKEEGGYLYDAMGNRNARLFLGFVPNLQEADITFINPYWTGNSGCLELLPASRNNVSIVLSPQASQLGGRVTVEFNGSSPRIKVSFSSLPARPLNLGTARVGFKGVWPLKGVYYCSGFGGQIAILQRQLEPFGTIVLRSTATRIVANIVSDAIRKGLVRMDASDDLSREFIKDNLTADLCDLIFNDVSRRSVSFKSEVVLPDSLMNSYEGNQDGTFIRDLVLAI